MREQAAEHAPPVTVRPERAPVEGPVRGRGAILALQRSAGNRAVSRMLRDRRGVVARVPLATASRDPAALSDTELDSELSDARNWIDTHDTTEPGYDDMLAYAQRLAAEKQRRAAGSGGGPAGAAAPASAAPGVAESAGVPAVAAAGALFTPSVPVEPLGPPPLLGPEPIPWTPIAGETPLTLGTGQAAAADAVADLGLAGVSGLGDGAVVAGGTALGEGSVFAATGAATGGTVVADGAVAVAGATVTEGTVVAGAALETAAVAGAAVETAEVVTTVALASNPVGWIILGVIVAGGVVYLITRESEPAQAPGAPGGAPAGEPGTPEPAAAPGQSGPVPVAEPGGYTPAVAPGAPGGGPLQASGPLDGARNYPVADANGETITDIDHIEGDTLWEEKSAVSASDIPAWVAEHITGKFEAYLRARARLPAFYKDAGIGFRFENPLKPDFGEAIWNEVDRLRGVHPDVRIEIEIPPAR